MIFTWWSTLIIILTIGSVIGIIIGHKKDDNEIYGPFWILLIAIAFIGWGLIFSGTNAKTDIQPAHYTNKIITDKNIIIEYPDGEIDKLTDMVYLKDSIYVEKVTTRNTYNYKTEFYRIKK